MNDGSTTAFQELRPRCVALSAVTLRAPQECAPLLRELASSLKQTDKSLVSQQFANYIFFPIKPLLKPDLSENILTVVFEILQWLLETAWYVQGDEMTSQLIMLFTTFLARAKSEELRTAIYLALCTLFERSKDHVNVLRSRPSVAHLITQSLDEDTGLVTKIAALSCLNSLFIHLSGDTAASFLPGVTSALSRTILKINQKSSLVASSLTLLRHCIVQSMDGQVTAYRTDKWRIATESQLSLAISPILSAMTGHEYEQVREATLKLCKSVLESTTLAPSIFVECLLQLDHRAIPTRYESIIAKTLESYIDAAARILQGVDEGRKLNMLHTMLQAFTLLSVTSRQILSARFIAQMCAFIQFNDTKKLISIISDAEEAPGEPDILYISSEVRDVLIKVLDSCDKPEKLDLSTPELFWIAQKLGISTFSHAINHLSSQRNLALQSIVWHANQRGFEFRTELMNFLYPILAMPEPSLFSLQAISTACQYADVQEMMVANADYIVNSLSLAFVSLQITPQTPKILAILVHLAPDLVELIDDVVDGFFDVLDAYHGYEGIVEGIFFGLAGVVKAVSQQTPSSTFVDVIKQKETTLDDKSLEQRFAEVDDTETSSRKIDEEPQDQTSKSYQIVLQIMNKAQLFLSHGNDIIIIKVLNLMYIGIPIVAENENKFLPLVHLYWPQLMRRLESPNPFVVAMVMQVIARTITFAGSFMRMRINDDVLPAISDILHPQRDRRGNLISARQDWTGTGRRKVADGIQMILRSTVEDGGLLGGEREKALTYVEELAEKSEVMKSTLLQAREIDRLGN